MRERGTWVGEISWGAPAECSTTVSLQQRSTTFPVELSRRSNTPYRNDLQFAEQIRHYDRSIEALANSTRLPMSFAKSPESVR